MIYTDFLGNKVSNLGMGNMRLPVVGEDAWGDVNYAEAQKIIDLCFECGVNYFDTAYVYHKGDSERFLGEALKAHKRASYFLATKFLVTADADYKKVFAEQLKRLATDYIDYYLIHSVQDNNADMYINGGAIDYFLHERSAGRVKHLGFSFHGSLELLDRFLTLQNVRQAGGWEFVQIQFNYLDYYYGDAKALYDRICKENIPIIVMEPVRGGALANLGSDTEKALRQLHPWSSAAWALRFVKEFPQVKVVLSGMHNVEQLKDNVETFCDSTPLTSEDKAAIKRAADSYKSKISAPCTSCNYCSPNCPAGLNISTLIALYNEHEYVLDFLKQSIVDKVKALPDGVQPKNCLGCGECKNYCPQQIDIPTIMDKLKHLTIGG